MYPFTHLQFLQFKFFTTVNILFNLLQVTLYVRLYKHFKWIHMLFLYISHLPSVYQFYKSFWLALTSLILYDI